MLKIDPDTTIMFLVATGTNMSCSLGRQYKPVLSQFFLDVYGYNMCLK